MPCHLPRLELQTFRVSQMASSLLKLHLQTFKTLNSSNPSLPTRTHFLPLPLPSHHHRHYSSVSPIPQNLKHNKQLHLSPLCSSRSSSSSPPASKEEAILQAKACLLSSLEKPLNNPKLASGKLKKLKQPRFRLEVPVNDDSPSSLSHLAVSVFKDLSLRRKGSGPVKVLILWPDLALTEAAIRAFGSDHIGHIDIVSAANGGNNVILNSADVAVFLAPDSSELAAVKIVTAALYPKPVVMFNPRWGFEQEGEFADLKAFVGSFEVIYSFMGLEVRGVLSKRKGMIFKCVRDGVVSGERWSVLVEEEGGELKVVSSFKSRPSIDEVETVLYNLMAMNSPITRSAKFLKDLVSNVTGKK